MKKNKNLKSFLREEDGKTIKKSLLVASLGLIVGLGLSGQSTSGYRHNNHNSVTDSLSHSSGHANHSQHSSY